MMDISRLSIYASIFFLLVFAVSVHASPVVLPIINQNEFQSCIWGWCQTVAPAFLFTDINLTFANYSYISVYSNETNYSLEANHSLYCDSAINSSYANSSTWCGDAQTLQGNDSSYFYPYSNPFNFTNDTTWQYNQTTPAMDYCDDTFITLANEGNLNTNSSTYWVGLNAFPTLYEANISDLQSYILTSDEADLNTNSSVYWNGINAFSSLNNQVLSSLSNITINQNLNTSIYNITKYLPTSSSTVCEKDYNGTTLLWCDCFNTTHKWMANTC